MKTAFVQSAFYAGYFIVAIPASLFIKKTSCVILLGTAFILPRHRAVGRRPVLPD